MLVFVRGDCWTWAMAYAVLPRIHVSVSTALCLEHRFFGTYPIGRFQNANKASMRALGTPWTCLQQARRKTILVRGGGADGPMASPAASALGQDIEDLGLDADFSDEEAASISSR